ncbi:hypothetical protein [Aquitalea sp. USM4]|uniref:hypothetical protein n=1 Tax=Aquitalea sp. USM4 TaxID=1590041 RepID=UPI00103DD26C|nr:hypothetical protein [Aquitalea sp. USM4]
MKPTNKIELPAREYYKLSQCADILGCTIDDILHLGAERKIRICIYIGHIVENFFEATYNPENRTLKSIRIDDLDWNERINKWKKCSSLPWADEHGKYGALLEGLVPLTATTIRELELTGKYGWPIRISERVNKNTFNYFEIDENDGLLFSEPLITHSELEEIKAGNRSAKKEEDLPAERPLPRRQDGMARVIAALAAGYLGSTDDIGSKAKQILDDLAETQDRGGLVGLQLPDVKTLRGYLKQAQEQIKR